MRRDTISGKGGRRKRKEKKWLSREERRMVRGRRNERTVTAHMHSLSRRASAYSNFLPTLPRRFRIFSVRVNLNRVSNVRGRGARGGRTIYTPTLFFPVSTLDRIERNDSTIDWPSIFFFLCRLSRPAVAGCDRFRCRLMRSRNDDGRRGTDRESPWQFFRPLRCQPARALIVTARLFVIRDKKSRCNVCTAFCWQIRMAN